MQGRIRLVVGALVLGGGLIAASSGCAEAPFSAKPAEPAVSPTVPAAGPTRELRPEVAPVAGLPEAEAAHLLRRLTFGARPGEVAALSKSGLNAWLETQLHPERMEDTRGKLALEPFQDVLAPPKDLPEKFLKAEMMGDVTEGEAPKDEKGINKLTDFGRLLSFAQMSQIVRQAESERQLFEVMVDFWTNHFNVFARKGLVKLFAADYVERAIRPNALGKFSDLLLATAQHPAMLIYLDNAQSSAEGSAKRGKNKVKHGGITENYARELLELHTLGVDAGYTQEDVIGVARILTGWSIERAGAAGPGFLFKSKAHDRGEKLVLGQIYPAGRGLEEGQELLRRLANDPRTARHLARKLCARLVADTPPESCIQAGSQAFLESGGEIRKLVRAIVSSAEFSVESNRFGEMKSPLEFMVSAIRVLDGKIEGDARRLAKMAEQLGEPLLMQAVPTGYPETAKQWASATGALSRMNYSIQLASGRVPGVDVDLERLFPNAEAEALVNEVNRVILSGAAAPATLEAIAEQVRQTPKEGERRQVAVALVLGSPDFQRQ